MTDINPVIAAVTARIIERSRPSRAAYLKLMKRQGEHGVNRQALSCGNLAHASAASGNDKSVIQGMRAPNIAIKTAYNDMLSAHQLYERRSHGFVTVTAFESALSKVGFVSWFPNSNGIPANYRQHSKRFRARVANCSR